MRGDDFAAPPLVRDRIGQQADAGFVADAGARDGGQLGSVNGRQRVVGQFDNVQALGLSIAEAVGEEVVFLVGSLRELIAGGLVADGEIDLDVASAD